MTGPTGRDERVLLRFGAVDYRAEVWVNGKRAGSFEGGAMKQRGKPMFFWCGDKSECPVLAMTEDRYKFLSSLDLSGPKEELLFDLDADPNETKNRVQDQPDVAKRMRAALVEWHRAAVASQAGKDYA